MPSATSGHLHDGSGWVYASSFQQLINYTKEFEEQVAFNVDDDGGGSGTGTGSGGDLDSVYDTYTDSSTNSMKSKNRRGHGKGRRKGIGANGIQTKKDAFLGMGVSSQPELFSHVRRRKWVRTRIRNRHINQTNSNESSITERQIAARTSTSSKREFRMREDSIEEAAKTAALEEEVRQRRQSPQSLSSSRSTSGTLVSTRTFSFCLFVSSSFYSPLFSLSLSLSFFLSFYVCSVCFVCLFVCLFCLPVLILWYFH